jgi:hypothetical protein
MQQQRRLLEDHADVPPVHRPERRLVLPRFAVDTNMAVQPDQAGNGAQ